MASSLPPRSTRASSTEADDIPSSEALRGLGPYIRRSTGLSHFHPGPHPVARLGRNPRRCSNHRVVVRSFDRPYPHTVLHPLGGGHGLSGLRRLSIIIDPLVADRLTLRQTPFPSDWWLPLLCQARTSTTFPLPLQRTGILLLARTCMRPTSLGLPSAILIHGPRRTMHYSDQFRPRYPSHG
jgi:hypothetical protein